MFLDYAAVFAPFVAFLIAGLFGRIIGYRGCQLITCFGVILAAIASMRLFLDLSLGEFEPRTLPVLQWIKIGNFDVSWALRLDSLSIVMMNVITIVSSCVHVYSVGYMSEDPSKGRFMAYLSLFTFAMLMLVTADNLLQLFFGWEGVGLASYLLIGFWFEKNSANAAAVKAFIVNRVGDFGLSLGIIACFILFGSIQFDAIFSQAPAKATAVFNFLGYDVHALTLVCLLLFVGAVGKSAQLGLHTWLPDAMEGPTPVSALIHAATMVTAGVFLVARFSPVFEYAPDALMVVTVVGALTAIVAATIGMTQFDIKRVIAYSTMSQLGYMFFALGVSAYSAAMFHLVTHAFFKALLFLGAGSVIHAMHHEQDMRKMGGIWNKIPVTYVLMWIGSLALAGVPFFAGYYSKDLIIESAFADHTWFGNFAFWIGIVAALLTAFYSWRLIIMTFHGAPRWQHAHDDHHHAHTHHANDDHHHDHGHHEPHESPPVMLLPLVVLAIGALFSGAWLYNAFAGTPHHAPAGQHEISTTEHHGDVASASKDAHHKEMTRDRFFGNSLHILPENDTVAAAHNVPKWVKVLPIIMGAAGIFLAYVFFMWLPQLPALCVRIFAPIHNFFFRKWYFDELYDVLFVKTSFWLGKFFWQKGDQATIDGLGPDGISARTKDAAGVLSRFQSGFVYQYAFVMIIGVIVLISWIYWRQA
ncbi:MAG: NADH-quinone oxidoreductase subunit L [Alphaproteobacteria bacterium]|nr:NADH-quinone oxidoreductase subunit L [Alphaproteobacteria bacterium]